MGMKSLWWNSNIFLLLIIMCISFSTEAQEKTWYVPNGIMLQYAGNIGMFSAGPTWNYGKNCKWETIAMAGFVPGKNGNHGATTFTLKENFSPWNIAIENKRYNNITLEPVVFSFFGNIITGKQYWFHEPKKYNNGDYYRYSSRVRAELGMGSRINLNNIAFYYEFSTYDLAIRYAICNKTINLFDILSLGIGVQTRF